VHPLDQGRLPDQFGAPAAEIEKGQQRAVDLADGAAVDHGRRRRYRLAQLGGAIRQACFAAPGAVAARGQTPPPAHCLPVECAQKERARDQHQRRGAAVPASHHG